MVEVGLVRKNFTLTTTALYALLPDQINMAAVELFQFKALQPVQDFEA